MADQIDGGEGLLEAFRALGIEHVFSSPGSEWAPAWEAFARQRRDSTPGPTYYDLTHETLAVAMATGYWLGSRRMAAVLLHAGPGLLQGANAIHGALLTGAPMLVASSESVTYGEYDGPDPGSQWYRNLSVVGGPHTFAAPWVKWSNQVPGVDTLYEMTKRAAEIAQRQPSGPVYLNVPLEALLAPWERPKIAKATVAPGAKISPPEEITALAKKLTAARKIAIVTESAGRDPEAFAALTDLATLLKIPVIEPQSAICVNFPKDHEMFAGNDTSLLKDSDLIVFLSCRSPWYPPSNSPAPDAEVVVIDEVPQRPHVVYQVLHADMYLEGAVGRTLRALVDEIEANPDAIDSAIVAERELVWGEHHDNLAAEIEADERKALANTEKITPPLLVRTLREELDADTVFVDETITHSRMIQRHLRWNEPDKWFYVQGGLGQGTGVALGMKKARPEQPVVLTIGDGTFLYNPVMQALLAAKDFDLPLLIIVFNNKQYLSMKFNHLRFYPEGAAVANDDFDGVDLSTQPPLSKFGEPFGLPGWEVSDPAELAGVIREAKAAVAAGSTAIVNVTLGR